MVDLRTCLFLLLFSLLAPYASVLSNGQDIPTVELDNGTFVGVRKGAINRFLGIPFAEPPYVYPIVSLIFTDEMTELATCASVYLFQTSVMRGNTMQLPSVLPVRSKLQRFQYRRVLANSLRSLRSISR